MLFPPGDADVPVSQQPGTRQQLPVHRDRDTLSRAPASAGEAEEEGWDSVLKDEALMAWWSPGEPEFGNSLP